MSIGECTWDKRGYVHERVLSMCADTFPYPTVSFTVTALLADSRCRSGKSEVDGSDPPLFASRIGTAGQADVHRRALAWEGRSRPIYPSREGGQTDKTVRGSSEAAFRLAPRNSAHCSIKIRRRSNRSERA